MAERETTQIDLSAEPSINPDDTQPGLSLNRSLEHDINDNQRELVAPPPLLMWGILILFVFTIAGVLAGVVVFRDVLTPGQQVRVIGVLPFMEALLPARPGPDDTLPTAGPVDEDAAQSLLTSPLDFSVADTSAEESAGVTGDQQEIAEEPDDPLEEIAPVVEPTAIPEPSTPTPDPPTPTPDIEPTQVSAAPGNDQNTSASVAIPQNSQQWPIAHRNYGFRHQQQTWNNCGPANITMALSYYGWQNDQAHAANILKPSREDKNVSPHEMVEFVNAQTTVRALSRLGGDLNLLRTLVSNEFPVIIERSFTPEGYDWTGHYQTIVGYDDTQRSFAIYDSFLGIGNGDGIFESYNELDRYWRAFNRVFIVIYEPAREGRLLELLGERADPADAAMHAFEVAQQEARQNPQDGFAWFNMGTSLTELGRFREAATAYDKAFELGLPWRMLWYQFGPYEAFYEEGRYNDVITLVEANLSNGGEYVEETYYWQGRALAAMGRTGEASTAFRNAINRNRNFADARRALDTLS